MTTWLERGGVGVSGGMATAPSGTTTNINSRPWSSGLGLWAGNGRLLVEGWRSIITIRTLLFEHRHLALVVGFAATAAGGSDHGQHGQRIQGGAGDEDALRVRAQIGRVHQVSLGHILGEVGGHQALENLVVLEAQANPEAL